MGLPQIIIDFQTKAETAAKRLSKGTVAIILKDITNVTFDTQIYTKESDIVGAHWTTANRDYLAKVFLGNPARVIVERISTTVDTVSKALLRLKNKQFNYLTMPVITAGDDATIVTWIKAERDTYKRTCKAVLSMVINPDYEGIINFINAGILVGVKAYTATEYCCRIAGLLAGLPLTQSATYEPLTELTSITDAVDPNVSIDAGTLILLNDGVKIKLARGINSLVTLGTKTADMKKIKIVEGMDIIRDDIRSTFEDNYIGVTNSYDNKVMFIAAINNYFKMLVTAGVLFEEYENVADIDIEAQRTFLALTQDISTWSDTQIKKANTGTNIFVTANIKMQDAIEDMTFTILN